MNPRLLDVKAAAAYLGSISHWTVRAYVEKGDLVPVRLPSLSRNVNATGEGSRRLLFDVRDLDAFAERAKRESAG